MVAKATGIKVIKEELSAAAAAGLGAHQKASSYDGCHGLGTSSEPGTLPGALYALQLTFATMT